MILNGSIPAVDNNYEKIHDLLYKELPSEAKHVTIPGTMVCTKRKQVEGSRTRVYMDATCSAQLTYGNSLGIDLPDPNGEATISILLIRSYFQKSIQKWEHAPVAIWSGIPRAKLTDKYLLLTSKEPYSRLFIGLTRHPVKITP
ncbi:MAG: hypothetical protein V1495_06690 [Pseudomonadota bacterium]